MENAKFETAPTGTLVAPVTGRGAVVAVGHEQILRPRDLATREGPGEQVATPIEGAVLVQVARQTAAIASVIFEETALPWSLAFLDRATNCTLVSEHRPTSSRSPISLPAACGPPARSCSKSLRDTGCADGRVRRTGSRACSTPAEMMSGRDEGAHVPIPRDSLWKCVLAGHTQSTWGPHRPHQSIARRRCGPPLQPQSCRCRRHRRRHAYRYQHHHHVLCRRRLLSPTLSPRQRGSCPGQTLSATFDPFRGGSREPRRGRVGFGGRPVGRRVRQDRDAGRGGR